jgi:DNA polymerase
VTRDDAVREALRARIEWLRILGVSAIATGGGPRAKAPAPAAAMASAAPSRGPAPPLPDPAAPPAGGPQTGLFGVAEEEIPAAAAETPASPGEARRGKLASGASPLLAAVAAEGASGAAGLALVRDDIGDCRRCRLCEKRTQVVFGVGDPGARLMFVGEGPGADEDAQGEPFVGRAGQLLTKMIEAMGLKRSQVYIANVVKCRPPENRTPLPDEVATCSPFLFRQIAAIGPRVIVCLGTPSAQAVLGTRETITRLRGTFRDVGGYRVMPTFHPAYLLRNPAAKRDVWEDLKQVMAAIAES